MQKRLGEFNIQAPRFFFYIKLPELTYVHFHSGGGVTSYHQQFTVRDIKIKEFGK